MPTLDQLTVGQRARVESVGGSPGIAQRLMEMGVLDGEEVEVLGFAPLGDPMEIMVQDYRLSLRLAEARGVGVTVL
jgi:Fe2+ transport system protein FeoA